MVTISTIYSYEVQRNEKIEIELSKNLDFKTKIQELSDTEKNLKTLLEFVSTQKNKITAYESSINQLEKQKQNLEPLVNADKKTVEALFKSQEQRAKNNASQERWVGFGLGILASIIASFVMVIGKFFLVSRRENL